MKKITYGAILAAFLPLAACVPCPPGGCPVEPAYAPVATPDYVGTSLVPQSAYAPLIAAPAVVVAAPAPVYHVDRPYHAPVRLWHTPHWNTAQHAPVHRPVCHPGWPCPK
jgi:hypothetical protein